MITLSTLPQATAQQVFDQVAAHLLSQKERSLISDKLGFSTCAYRGAGGMKCAAGCLISDEEYRHEYEGLPWNRLILRGNITNNHAHLICKLQSIHDCEHEDIWKPSLRQLAEDHGLNFSDPRS